MEYLAGKACAACDLAQQPRSLEMSIQCMSSLPVGHKCVTDRNVWRECADLA